MSKSRLINEKPKVSLQSAYRPPNVLQVRGKEPGFRYRWVRLSDTVPFFGGQDHRNWEIVRNGAGGKECQDTEFTGTFNQFSPKALGSIIRAGDLVLARMPEDDAVARNQSYAIKAKNALDRTKDPKRDIGSKDRKYFSGSIEGVPDARPVRGQVDLKGDGNA